MAKLQGKLWDMNIIQAYASIQKALKKTLTGFMNSLWVTNMGTEQSCLKKNSSNRNAVFLKNAKDAMDSRTY